MLFEKKLGLANSAKLEKIDCLLGAKIGSIYLFIYLLFFYFEIFNQGLSNPKVSLKSETLRCHTCLVCRRIAHQPSDLGYCVFILSWRNHCRHLSNRRGCQKKKERKKNITWKSSILMRNDPGTMTWLYWNYLPCVRSDIDSKRLALSVGNHCLCDFME